MLPIRPFAGRIDHGQNPVRLGSWQHLLGVENCPSRKALGGGTANQWTVRFPSRPSTDFSSYSRLTFTCCSPTFTCPAFWTSGGILIEFGATRALLMADAENARWEEWLATNPSPELLKPVHFLKASHHGSINGYHCPLYERLTDPATTIGVVTPFNHGRIKLPTADGVNAVRPHVQQLHCTNAHSARASTSLQWDSPPTTPPRLPAFWTVMIQRKPELGRLLIPAAGARLTPGPPPPLPLEWIAEATKKPELWRLIRPEDRLPIATPGSTDEHVVSAFYDDGGNLLDLKTGAGTGRLN